MIKKLLNTYLKKCLNMDVVKNSKNVTTLKNKKKKEKKMISKNVPIVISNKLE